MRRAIWESDATPYALEHNCEYRTAGVSLVISPYLRCAPILSVAHVACTFDAIEAEAVAEVTNSVKDLR
ncbi:MAG: hypothetical protein JWM21_3514 [Acidobacteria bacterium]|nr:hypothetical protein [Acidobacteriota bacterium]